MAIALSKEKVQAQHGLMMIYSFIALFVTNALILLLGNYFAPQSLVLGSGSVPFWWALYHVTLELTLISVFVMPLVTFYEWKKKVVFTPLQWMATYLFVNFIVLWKVSRYAEHLGFGVSSVWVLLVFSAVLDWVQGMVMMGIGKAIKM